MMNRLQLVVIPVALVAAQCLAETSVWPVPPLLGTIETPCCTYGSGSMRSIVASDSGRHIATLSDSGHIIIWDVDNRKVLQEFRGPVGLALDGEFSSDDTYLAAGNGHTLNLWSVSDGRLKGSYTFDEPIRSIDAFDDGSRFLIALGDNRITTSEIGILDTREEAWTGVLKAGENAWEHLRRVDGLAREAVLSPDASNYAIRSTSNPAGSSVRVVSLSQNEVIAEFKDAGDPPTSLIFMLDGRRVVVGDGKLGDFFGEPEKKVRVFDIVSGEEESSLALDGQVLDLDISPDGERILIGTGGTAMLWDTQQNDPFYSFYPSSQNVAFLGNGNKAVAASDWNQTVTIWETDVDRLTHEGRVPKSGITCAALSDERDLIAVGAEDGTIEIYSADAARSGAPFLPQETLTGHAGGVTQVAFSEDGGRLVSVGKEGKAVIWETASGERVSELANEDAAINCAAFFSRNGTALTGGSDGNIREWDLESGARLREFSPKVGAIHAFGLSDDGGLLFCGGHEPLIASVNTSTGLVSDTVRIEHGGARALAVNDQGHYLLVGHEDGSITEHTQRDLTQIGEYKHHGSPVRRLAYSPGHSYGQIALHENGVMLMCHWTGTIQTHFDGMTALWQTMIVDTESDAVMAFTEEGNSAYWEIPLGKITQEFSAHNGPFGSACISPDGEFVAAGGVWTGIACLWDRHTGRLIKEWRGDSNDTHVAFSPNGDELLIAGSEIVLMNPRDGSIRKTLEGPSYSTSGSFSSDGQYIVTGHEWEGTSRLFPVVVWDRASGDMIQRLQDHPRTVRQVEFTSDAQIVVTSCDDGVIRFLEVATGDEVGRADMVGDTQFALPIAVSPTEEVVAVMRRDMSPTRLEFYDMPSGFLYDEFIVGQDEIPGESRAITYSKDGKWIVGTRYVLDAYDGTHLYQIGGYTSEAIAVDVTDDGSAVALGRDDGTVLVWCLTDETDVTDWYLR